MEILYLICSIFSTLLTSLTLSLLLPFRVLIRLCISPRASSSSSSSSLDDASEPVTLYQGTVWHERRRPVHHSFRYQVRYALFDLDHATHAPPHHYSADEARQITDTTGPVLLLTIPPSVGYEQNPLSVYYCYDIEGSTRQLKNCIAELTNTPWAERVSFIFNPHSDQVAKALHVSPFMDMHGIWNMKTSDPGDKLTVTVSVHHPQLGNYFNATLKAKKVCSSSLGSDHALFFWLMPHKVALWIYWHALQLWWKKVAFIQHPRYANPAYKEEALMRDQKLQCCGAMGQRANDDAPQDRQFRWRDAKWPWS